MAGIKDCQNELTYSETKKDTENQYRSMLRQKEQAQKITKMTVIVIFSHRTNYYYYHYLFTFLLILTDYY